MNSFMNKGQLKVILCVISMIIVCIFFGILFGVIGVTNANGQNVIGNELLLTQYPEKGGFGVVYKNIFINLRAERNELFIDQDSPWIGLTPDHKQVVFVFNGKIFEATKIPSNFTISESILISFEFDKVLFFDFRRGVGGYYTRRR